MIITPKARVDHLAVARQYVARSNDWPLAPRFDPNERWYHRLAAENDYEVWLLTWLPGQGTDLHDHGGSAGAFVVVSGQLTERTVAATAGPVAGADRPALVDAPIAAGTGRWFGSHHIHQIINDGDRPAVSVHVYGPALKTMTRYQLDGDRLRIASIDRAGVQW
jgi:predicted metal-dependent enzyme (double-stranded beta helix superfamily)